MSKAQMYMYGSSNYTWVTGINGLSGMNILIEIKKLSQEHLRVMQKMIREPGLFVTFSFECKLSISETAFTL